MKAADQNTCKTLTMPHLSREPDGLMDSILISTNEHIRQALLLEHTSAAAFLHFDDTGVRLSLMIMTITSS